MYQKQKKYFKTEKGKQSRRKANQKYYVKLRIKKILDMDFQFRQLVRKKFWVISV